MLGICMKAGRLVAGSDVCEENIKAHKTKLLIVAEDASESTKSKFKNICNVNYTEYIVWGKIGLISKSIGKINKAIISINDEGISNKIKQLVNEIKGANN
jgi:ribosomal protein L7Ae-like RNA K-turn-binding protein